MKFSIHCSSGCPWLCPCQLSLGFTVEVGRKWKSNSVTMHYSTPWHLYRHYSNSFRVNNKMGMKFFFRTPKTLSVSTFMTFYCRIWIKWMAKSVTMHYSTPWHLYRHYSNSFRVNNKIGMHSSSGHPRLCLCQLSLGFTVEVGRKWKSKSVTMHYSTPWHLYRHYSNSFRVNNKMGMHSSSRHPRLCLCQLPWHFTVEFGRKWIAKSVTMHHSTHWYHTGITQIPSQLTWHFLYILLQDDHDSVCVNFHWVLL